MKKTTLLIMVFLAIILILSAVLLSKSFTGKAVEDSVLDNYSYTKAICNKTNYCQDYEIKCDGDEVVSMNPITGASVQYSAEWEDPRNEEMIKKVCG